jgi:hypothetical protein
MSFGGYEYGNFGGVDPMGGNFGGYDGGGYLDSAQGNPKDKSTEKKVKRFVHNNKLELCLFRPKEIVNL